MMSQPKYALPLAILGLSAGWLAFCWPWLFGGMTIPFDAKDYYYPALRFLAAARAAGDSGTWNPYLFSGMATIGDPLSWFFTPTMRLLAELVPAPSLRMVDTVELLHLLGGGVGLLLLLRRWGCGMTASLLGALIFCFGGPAAGRLQHVIMIVSYAWAPWALLALACTFDASTPRARWLGGIASGLCLALIALNRDHVAFLLVLLCCGYALVRLITAWRADRMRAADAVVALCPGVLLAGAVCAVPVLLTLANLETSVRAANDVITTGHASLQPAALLTLIAPGAFSALAGTYWGPGTLPWMQIAATGFDWTDDSVSHLYLGALPLLLLPVSIAAGFRHAGPGRFFAAGALVALVYALGAYTPGFGLLFDLVPGVALFRRPNDATFPLALCLAVVIPLGLARLQRREGVATSWLVGAAIAGAGLAMILPSLLATRLGLPAPPLANLLQPLPWLGVALFVLLVFNFSRRRFWLILIPVLAGADLIVHNSGAPFNAAPEAEQQAYTPTGKALAEKIRAHLDPAMPQRVEIIGLGGSWQNAPAVHQLEQTLGYSPLRDATYATTVGARQNSHAPPRDLTPVFTGYDAEIAQNLGLALVITGGPVAHYLPAGRQGALRLIEQVGATHIYAAPSPPLPRFRFIPAEGPGPTDAIVIEAYRTDRITLTVTASEAGMLHIANPYHPGWRATVDGKPADLRPVPPFFQALDLQAGRHRVVLHFDPLAGDKLRDTVDRILRPRPN